MAVLTLTQSVGRGLFISTSAVFFTSVIGFDPQSVALALSLAGACGFLSAIPIGKLADRAGPRLLLAINYAALAPLFAAYCFTSWFPSFLVIACLIAVGEISGSPLRAALTYEMFGPGEAVKIRAQMRSIFNLGTMSGAALAAAALSIGTREAFYAVMLITATAQLACAVLTLTLKSAGKSVQTGPRAASAVRDVRFIAVTIASGLLEMHAALLSIGIPLWITVHLQADAALIAMVISINTICVLALQVRLARNADTARGASLLQRRAGLWLALSCLLFAVTDFAPAVVVLIVVAVAAMTVGEIYQAAGSWGVSFELPPPGRQGDYQGVFALSRGLQQFLGPATVTAAVIGLGSYGWLLLAVGFAVTGLICPSLVKWADIHPSASRPAGATAAS
jgi:hypothetical protein